MIGALLVINSGSSSIKFGVYGLADSSAPEVMFSGRAEAVDASIRFTVADAAGRKMADSVHGPDSTIAFSHVEALGLVWRWLDSSRNHFDLVAAGHRVVHGGDQFLVPVMVDATVLDQLERLTSLAPLHQPSNLSGIHAMATITPGLPQFACFDTAFHVTQPPVARAFALPAEYTNAGIKRFGFHGLSFEYIASVLPRYLGKRAEGKIVIAHLGSGAGMCALLGRRSVAATTGFSALDGLPMGTRCGAIDPGVILYLLQEKGMDVESVSELLYRQSGLLGVSGLSQDMRVLLSSDEPAAAAAVALFVYRIGRELGSLAAALGGLDGLIFTGGIGEHSAEIRSRICAHAEWLGIRIDENENSSGSEIISSPVSKVAVLVIPTNEEAVIAGHTARLHANYHKLREVTT